MSLPLILIFLMFVMMFMYYFFPLVISSNTPASVTKDLYKDVNLEYLSQRAQMVDKLAFYLMKVSIPLAVVTLRTMYNIKKFISL